MLMARCLILLKQLSYKQVLLFLFAIFSYSTHAQNIDSTESKKSVVWGTGLSVRSTYGLFPDINVEPWPFIKIGVTAGYGVYKNRVHYEEDSKVNGWFRGVGVTVFPSAIDFYGLIGWENWPMTFKERTGGINFGNEKWNGKVGYNFKYFTGKANLSFTHRVKNETFGDYVTNHEISDAKFTAFEFSVCYQLSFKDKFSITFHPLMFNGTSGLSGSGYTTYLVPALGYPEESFFDFGIDINYIW